MSGASGLAWKRSVTETSTGVSGKSNPGRLYMVDTDNDALYIVDTVTGSATPTDAFPVDSSVREFGGTVRTPGGDHMGGGRPLHGVKPPGEALLTR